MELIKQLIKAGTVEHHIAGIMVRNRSGILDMAMMIMMMMMIIIIIIIVIIIRKTGTTG